jgi:hypothetical protein
MKERPKTIKSASREKNRTYQKVLNLPYSFQCNGLIKYDVGDVGAGLLSCKGNLTSFLPLFTHYIHILLLANGDILGWTLNLKLIPHLRY